ncbi:MAG: heavy-metal-associated domain-containing protein [Brevinematia bacterium]
MKRVKLSVSGMSCQGCMNTVKNALLEVEGVREVAVTLVPGSAEIICEDSVSEESLVKTINDTTIYKANLYNTESLLPEELE